MTKLTEAQRFALSRLPVSYMMWGPSVFYQPEDGIRVATLDALERRGLITQTRGAMSVECRITESGRLALADKTSPPLSPVAREGKEQP